MKLYSSFIFLLLIATMSSAGIKKQRKHLLGEWQVESVDLSSMLLNVPEDEKEMMEMFIPMIEEGMKTLTWNFNKSGDFISKSSFMEEDIETKGSWSLGADGKTLTTEVEGEKNIFVLTELSKSKLSTSIDIEGGAIHLQMKKIKK